MKHYDQLVLSYKYNFTQSHE